MLYSCLCSDLFTRVRTSAYHKGTASHGISGHPVLYCGRVGRPYVSVTSLRPGNDSFATASPISLPLSAPDLETPASLASSSRIKSGLVSSTAQCDQLDTTTVITSVSPTELVAPETAYPVPPASHATSAFVFARPLPPLPSTFPLLMN